MNYHTTAASPIYTTRIDPYASIIEHIPSKHTQKCIDGKITGCGNCIGYYQYEGHPGFLTAELRKKHDCLKKGCYHYIQKPKSEKYFRKRPPSETHILSIAREKASHMEGLKVLSVCGVDDGWKINYISISNEYSLLSLAEQMSDELKCKINFVKLNYSFDRCVHLILAN